LNFNLNTYSIYINNTDIGCTDKNLSISQVNASSIYFQQTVDALESYTTYIDDITLCEGIILTSNLTAPNVCTDTDGYNPLIKGQVIYNNNSYIDECIDDYIVDEYICTDNIVDANIINCADYGVDYYCNDGKCIVSTPLTCTYPSLFCDNFDYFNDVTERGWIATDSTGNSISLFPNGNELNITDTGKISLTHRLDSFNLQYFKNGYWYAMLDTEYTPVMSGEFEFTPIRYQPSDNYSCIYYQGISNKNAEIFELALCPTNITKDNINYTNAVFYKNYTSGDVVFENVSASNWDWLCDDCLLINETNTLRVTSLFKQRSAFAEYFTTSTSSDKTIVILNGVMQLPTLGVIGGQSVDTDSLKKFSIIKDINAMVSIDDYYVFTGSNKNYDDTQDYFSNVSLVVFEPETNVTTGTGIISGEKLDWASVITGFWSKIGLRSVASRALFSVFLMFMLAILYVILSMSTMHSPNPIILVVLEIFAIIVLTYLGLIAVWIVIVMIILLIIISILTIMMKAGR
jgi:Fe-S cluster biosynthesis and repair protein YggX